MGGIEHADQAHEPHRGVGQRPGKAYGDKVALDDVGLSIGEGEVFALPGLGGAGKTTTVKILSTLIPADAGTASVMGATCGPTPARSAR